MPVFSGIEAVIVLIKKLFMILPSFYAEAWFCQKKETVARLS